MAIEIRTEQSEFRKGDFARKGQEGNLGDDELFSILYAFV